VNFLLGKFAQADIHMTIWPHCYFIFARQALNPFFVPNATLSLPRPSNYCCRCGDENASLGAYAQIAALPSRKQITLASVRGSNSPLPIAVLPGRFC
jgi:hypothetical protein